MANSYGITPQFATLLLSALGGGRPRVPILCGQLHDGNPGPQGVNNPSAVTSRQELIVSAPNAGAVALTGVPPSWEIIDEETIAAISLWSGFDGDPNAMCLFTLAAMPPVTVAEGDTLVLGACDLEWAPAAAGLWAPGKTVAAPTALGAAGMLVPRITAGGVVAAPSMSAVAGMKVPVVQTYRTPAPVMHGSAGMLTPTVTAGAKVTAPLARAAAAALAPTVATRVAVAAPVMTAAAAALAPTATTRTVVSVPAMAAAAQTLMPRLGGSAVIPVMTAEASATELPPTISASAVIDAQLMAAAAGMLAPTLKTTLPIAFDALGSGVASLGSSGSWSHNATGNYVLAFVATDSGKATSAVSYGGTPMTLIGYAYHDNASSYGQLSVWGLASPPSGAKTVTAAMNGSNYFVANTVSYKNISSVASYLTAYGAGAASQAMTCGAGQMIVHGFGVGASFGGGTFSAYSGGTERYNGAEGGYTGLLIQDSSAATTFTGTTSSDWSAVGVVLQ